jgi:hypothetical protein
MEILNPVEHGKKNFLWRKLGFRRRQLDKKLRKQMGDLLLEQPLPKHHRSFLVHMLYNKMLVRAT